jgi:hypothetical protein
MNVRGLLALLVALGGVGTSSYYISDGVSPNPSPNAAIASTSTSAAAVLSEASAPTSSGVRCGKERWSVKTLKDPDASKVDFTPIPSTITALGSVAAPASGTDLPRQPQEENTYTVKGTIVGYKLEDDNDIHLAIADTTPPFATMIAEFPNKGCDVGAVDEAQIDQARQAFETAFPPATKHFQTPTGCVTVTGVFFFDRIHGQLGVAPNGAELHPVIGFQNGCAAGAGTSTTTPTTTTTSTIATAPTSCSYRDDGALPDSACTPGALNPDVTPATIDSTICKHGWTATIRPPVSMTGPMKLESMKQYGVGGKSPGDYEYDHLVSLELGGAPDDQRNLWPEPHTVGGDEGSFAKDKVENKLKRAVCNGTMSLADAQHTIATDWRKAQQ